MKNIPKTAAIIKIVITIICLSVIVAFATVGITHAWAKIETVPDIVVESPTLPHKVIEDPCVYMHTRGEHGALPIVNYTGKVQFRWYDSAENAFWFSADTIDLYEEICLFVDEHKVPEAFYLYMDRIDMYVDITCAERTTINDWYMVDKATNIHLGKPTNKQLENRYELDWQYPVVKKGLQPETVYLSQLKPNVIYSYIPDLEGMLGYPNIINDTGKACLLYTKHQGLDATYGVYACPTTMVNEDFGSSFACSFYEEGDEYRIMYTIADNEALYRVAEIDTITLTDLIEWGDVASFYMYIYNNTDKEYVISCTPNWEEYPSPVIVNLKPGEIMGCWGPSHTVTVEENK